MNNKLKIAGAAFASALFAGSALAEISLNPNLSVDGYAAGSAQYSRYKYEAGGNTDDSTMDLDAVRLNANFKYDKTSAKISLYSPAGDDVVVPEAYVSYDFGNGIVATAGRFLTWAGYESFDIPALNAITYADEWTGIIPSHHDGVKVTYTFDNFTVGGAVLDSVYGPTAYRGDGDINKGSLGAELYFGYNDQTFSAAATIGYQHDHVHGLLDEHISSDDTFYVNIWGQYYIDSSKTTLGIEVNYQQADAWTSPFSVPALIDSDIYTAQVSVKQAITEKWAITGRLSGGQLDADNIPDKASFVKATVAPSLTLTENLEVRGEVSYTTFDKTPYDDGFFVGVQAVFKF
ncbi:porin [Termitidicoccus mucosus]|uniref:Porin n=1 Tax=Termitidicoccus mucosus TaxID=1184151 RepID=A0A178IAQ0_9BACT|nr:hypothetical protein AW736_25435 [Opitutaceae bacterium TSB47]